MRVCPHGPAFRETRYIRRTSDSADQVDCKKLSENCKKLLLDLTKVWDKVECFFVNRGLQRYHEVFQCGPPRAAVVGLLCPLVHSWPFFLQGGDNGCHEKVFKNKQVASNNAESARDWMKQYLKGRAASSGQINLEELEVAGVGGLLRNTLAVA